jgi:hypothetical protein
MTGSSAHCSRLPHSQHLCNRVLGVRPEQGSGSLTRSTSVRKTGGLSLTGFPDRLLPRAQPAAGASSTANPVLAPELVEA